jgi:hypothetical protein
MTKRLTVLLLSATLVSGAGLFAQTPSVPPSTTLRLRGTIDKYDASTRTLSLSTSRGTVQIPLASTTRISQGGRKVDALALQKLAGDYAIVRYTESDGNKVVESIHVFEK